MHYPAFFDKVRPVVLYDPLAEFLGAAENGLVEYTYLDAVKLAGHSCPTVAGAYLMTIKALQALYPGSTPERAAVRVRLRDPMEHGVTGVIANVVGLLTGATQKNGFKGIAGRFDRRNLLFFDAGIDADMHFERIVAEHGSETGRTYVFDIIRGYAWPPEYPGRALRNRFMERWHGREGALKAALETERAAYQAAAREGDFDTAVVWAGEAVDLIKSVESAAALVARISAEAEAQLRAGAGLAR